MFITSLGRAGGDREGSGEMETDRYNKALGIQRTATTITQRMTTVSKYHKSHAPTSTCT